MGTNLVNMHGLLEDIDIRRIQQSTFPVRTDTGDINQLATSIKENGLLQPIITRPDGNRFEIIAGHRRFLACKRLSLRRIPCLIVDLADKQAYELSLIENIQRKTMNPIEEAQAYRRYVADYGWGGVSELAKQIGKSQEYVTKRMKLLELPKSIQDDIIRRRIKTSIAEELTYVKDKERQSELAKMIAIRSLTVRKLREAAKTPAERSTDIDHNDARTWKNKEYSVVAFDKSIVALKLALNRLDDVIDSIEEDWFTKECLIYSRGAIHSQIDQIIRNKRKYTNAISANVYQPFVV